MGGVRDPDTGIWSGPNFMPVGGQYLMVPEQSSTKLSSSFNGTLDGQGHVVANIYCNRHCGNGNFGDGQSVGLIGRLGCHDNDPRELWAEQPGVRNVVVSGYIKGNRSVGGIQVDNWFRMCRKECGTVLMCSGPFRTGLSSVSGKESFLRTDWSPENRSRRSSGTAIKSQDKAVR